MQNANSAFHLRLFPIGYEELTVNAAVVRPAPALARLADFATVQFDGGQTRYRVDGTDPTASVGTQTFDGREETFTRTELRTLALTRATSLNATARFTYYQYI